MDGLPGRCRGLGERGLPVVHGNGGGDQQHTERLRDGVEVLQGRPAPLRVQRPPGEDDEERGERPCDRRRTAEDADDVEHGLPETGSVAACEPEPVRAPQRRADDDETPAFRQVVRPAAAVERGLVAGVQQRAAEHRGSGGKEYESVGGEGVEVDAPRGCGRLRALPLRGLDAPVECPHAGPDERDGEFAEARRTVVQEIADVQRERERNGYRGRAEDEVDVDLASERPRLSRMTLHGALRRSPEQGPHREADASRCDAEGEGARAFSGDDVSGDHGEQGARQQGQAARRGDERGEREPVQEDPARRPDAGVAAVAPRTECERDDAGRSSEKEQHRDDGDDEEVEVGQHR